MTYEEIIISLKYTVTKLLCFSKLKFEINFFFLKIYKNGYYFRNLQILLRYFILKPRYGQKNICDCYNNNFYYLKHLIRQSIFVKL